MRKILMKIYLKEEFNLKIFGLFLLNYFMEKNFKT